MLQQTGNDKEQDQVERSKDIKQVVAGQVVIQKAIVNVGDSQAEVEVDPTQPSVSLTIELSEGKNTLKTHFIDAENNQIPVYYHSVKLLK